MRVMNGLKDCVKLASATGIKPQMPVDHAQKSFRTLSMIGLVILLVFLASLAHADINAGEYCEAIYIIEGGARTAHPYGILKKYKNTSPRQACINTVKHAYRDWLKDSRGLWFEEYLGARYCPVGSDTDNGTCKYWVNNLMSVMAQKSIY